VRYHSEHVWLEVLHELAGRDRVHLVLHAASRALQLSHSRLASYGCKPKETATSVYSTVLTHQLLCESAYSEPIDNHKWATVPYMEGIIHNMHTHQLLQALLQQCTPLTAGLNL
jgi:hypothetical protein